MHLICRTEDVGEREAKGFTTPVGDIILTQRDGSFYAYHNLCPHLQVNLEYLEDEFLDRDKEYLICSTHGALFEIEQGQCIWGPCQGEFLTAVAIEIHSDGGVYLIQSNVED